MSSGACQKHGPQNEWAFACKNLGDALIAEQIVGFNWGIDEGFHWTFCDECAVAVRIGDKRVHEGVPICHECFWEAWALNGKPEKFQ